MSVSIATLGMFTAATGGSAGSSGPVYIKEEKKKPMINILSVKTEDNIKESNILEIKSIILGE